jgi:hypothetical protein
MSKTDYEKKVEEAEFRRLRQGTYADILFVLLPFLAIAIQLLWAGDMDRLLLGAEISMAAAIIGGLSISKFIQGILLDPKAGIYKERLVFVIASTFFVILLPSVIVAMKLTTTDDAPELMAFIQPAFLVASISLYISAVRIIRSREEQIEDELDEDEDLEQALFSAKSLHAADEHEAASKKS